MFDLTGLVAIITGGNGGIGLGMAMVLGAKACDKRARRFSSDFAITVDGEPVYAEISGAAQDVVKKLQGITPLVIPSAKHWRIPDDREFYLAGLRLAAGKAH